jgi:hypothetical protein
MSTRQDNEADDHTRALVSPADLLSGQFQYTIAIPRIHRYSKVGLVVYGDYKEYQMSKSLTASAIGTVTNTNASTIDTATSDSQLTEELLSVAALGQIDSRLRSSLPLLVPLASSLSSATISSAVTDNLPSSTGLLIGSSTSSSTPSNESNLFNDDSNTATTTSYQGPSCVNLLISYLFMSSSTSSNSHT